MQRINTATKAVDLFGAGKHGFRDGDLVGGVPATDFNAAWFNGVQEEPLAVVESVGLVADGNVLTQLRQAINRIAGRNIKTITAANSPYAVTADDAGLLLIDATAGNVVVNMPAAASVKAIPFTLRRVDATANTVTINRAGADTLDGANSAPLVGKGQWVHYRSDGVSLFQAYGASAGVTRFTANGSFTVPTGVTTIYVSGCAGGGGGGGGMGYSASFQCSGGGGGAGQAVVRSPYAVTPGQVIAITIGGAGSSGTGGPTGSNGGSGGNGGGTSVGAPVNLTLLGGSGGGAGASGTYGAAGAGYPSGGFGLGTSAVTTNYCPAGVGASSPFGGGGGGGASGNPAGTNGGPAAGYGSGGGGGGGCTASGNGAVGGGGAPGIVIIEW